MELIYRGAHHKVAPGQPFTIGRSPACNLRITDDLMVSGMHCVIDGMMVRDDGSTNGTLLNNEPLDPGKKYNLFDRSVIRVGSSELEVRISEPSDLLSAMNQTSSGNGTSPVPPPPPLGEDAGPPLGPDLLLQDLPDSNADVQASLPPQNALLRTTTKRASRGSTSNKVQQYQEAVHDLKLQIKYGEHAKSKQRKEAQERITVLRETNDRMKEAVRLLRIQNGGRSVSNEEAGSDDSSSGDSSDSLDDAEGEARWHVVETALNMVKQEHATLRVSHDKCRRELWNLRQGRDKKRDPLENVVALALRVESSMGSLRWMTRIVALLLVLFIVTRLIRYIGDV